MREFGLAEQARFEWLVLPHVDAAFNLAYWLLTAREDAEDDAQETFLRTSRYCRGSRVEMHTLAFCESSGIRVTPGSEKPDFPLDEDLPEEIGVRPRSLAIPG